MSQLCWRCSMRRSRGLSNEGKLGSGERSRSPSARTPASASRIRRRRRAPHCRTRRRVGRRSRSQRRAGLRAAIAGARALHHPHAELAAVAAVAAVAESAVSLSARPFSSHTIRARASSVWTARRTHRGSSAGMSPKRCPIRPVRAARLAGSDLHAAALGLRRGRVRPRVPKAILDCLLVDAQPN
jgi:hypothetical protein